jgi:hypothetical protein
LVTSIRGRDATLANQPIGYLDNMKMLFDRGERFFPVCKYLADRLIAWGCPSEKIRVLYGGVDLNEFKYRAPHKRDSQNILSIGRLVEKKGHHILMQAFQKIRGKFPNATLTIIGRGGLEEYLISLANQLNLGDSFRLLNHLPKDQVREQMTNADIFCAASLEAADGDVEGIPNTLKEAMAIGVPVISTNHAGIPELITNNKEGVLVQENNVDELAEALEFMLSNREIWETYTVAARQKVEQKFNLAQQLQQQAEFYDELVAPYKVGKRYLVTPRQIDKKVFKETPQPQQQGKDDGETIAPRKKAELAKKALIYMQQLQQLQGLQQFQELPQLQQLKQVPQLQQQTKDKVKDELVASNKNDKKAKVQQRAKDHDEKIASRKKEKKAHKAEKVKKALYKLQKFQQQAIDEQLGGDHGGL